MQMDMIARITEYCVRKDIISSNDAEWFSYGLVQRSEKLITICFLFPLGWLLSSFSTSLAFYELFPASDPCKWLPRKNFCRLSAVFCLQRMCAVFADIAVFEKRYKPLDFGSIDHHNFLACPLQSSKPSHDEGRTGSVQTYGKVNRADIRYGTDFEPEYKVLCVCQRNCTRTRLYGLFTHSGTRKTEI